jgi:hypothetical protein
VTSLYGDLKLLIKPQKNARFTKIEMGWNWNHKIDGRGL